jgi:outer membrane protein OmpA-like peptidoglycan-associated protein
MLKIGAQRVDIDERLGQVRAQALADALAKQKIQVTHKTSVAR